MALVQRFAKVFGAIYLIVGILGFLPFLVVNDPAISAAAIGGPFTGLLINIFAVNWFHNLVHLLTGIAGLAVYRSSSASRAFASVLGVAYLALFIFGLIWGLHFLAGLLPLNWWDNGLHLTTSIIAFGAFFLGRVTEPGRAAHSL
jgi:hypothetical protein